MEGQEDAGQKGADQEETGKSRAEFTIRNVCVLQHTEAEFLGLMEDHFEGRNIRFDYQRPFTVGGSVPREDDVYDGLILLPGGPYGLVSGHLLPSFSAELRLTKKFLGAGKPVVGFGLGAVILGIAAGGGAEEAPLRFSVKEAERVVDQALEGYLPARFPSVVYMRDRLVLPEQAVVLARSTKGDPLVFEVGDNSLGFVGHPGMKSGMAEDLIMEFAETPPDTAQVLEELREKQGEIATVLSDIMVGLSRRTGWL